MPRPMKNALAAERAAAVINFMTVNARTAFTLSELTQALAINGASLITVLGALIDAGFVERRRKTYVLGPALVAAGHAASLSHPLIDLARPDMRRLARHGSECLSSMWIGDDLVILAIETAGELPLSDNRIGQRLPMVPPWGMVFNAWADASTVDRWLNGLGPEEVQPDRDSVERSMAAVRGRGFAVGLENSWVSETLRLQIEYARTPGDQGTRTTFRRLVPMQSENYWLDDIQDDVDYLPSNITAPVFGADGIVTYLLAIQGVGTVSGDRLNSIGHELVAVARGLTRRIGGLIPATEVVHA